MNFDSKSRCKKNNYKTDNLTWTSDSILFLFIIYFSEGCTFNFAHLSKPPPIFIFVPQNQILFFLETNISKFWIVRCHLNQILSKKNKDSLRVAFVNQWNYGDFSSTFGVCLSMDERPKSIFFFRLVKLIFAFHVWP